MKAGRESTEGSPLLPMTLFTPPTAVPHEHGPKSRLAYSNYSYPMSLGNQSSSWLTFQLLGLIWRIVFSNSCSWQEAAKKSFAPLHNVLKIRWEQCACF